MDNKTNIELDPSVGFNPWIKIWTQPRKTISVIVAKNPNKSIWILAFIYGCSSLLNSFQTFVVGHHVNLFHLYFLAILFAPFWGYMGLSVWSFFVSITGKAWKGAGTYKAVRAAYSWSCVPFIFNLAMWMVLTAFFGRALFMSGENEQPQSQLEAILLFAVLALRMGMMIWSVVIYVYTLAEVQMFSIFKAVGNLLSASLMVAAIVYLLLLLSR